MRKGFVSAETLLYILLMMTVMIIPVALLVENINTTSDYKSTERETIDVIGERSALLRKDFIGVENNAFIFEGKGETIRVPAKAGSRVESGFDKEIIYIESADLESETIVFSKDPVAKSTLDGISLDEAVIEKDEKTGEMIIRIPAKE